MANVTQGPRDPGLPPSTLRVVEWPDEIIDSLGFDPRSAYVERFWLGVIGPSTTWLLRHLVTELEAHPGGFDLDMEETARRLGLGHQGGRNSPFSRTLARMAQFGLASHQGRDVVGVRRKVPPLNLRQLRRLTPALQTEHLRWQEEQLALSPDRQRERQAIRLALSLVELGEERDATMRQLVEWNYRPELADRATTWAWDRHRLAREAAAERSVRERADEQGQSRAPRRAAETPELGAPTPPGDSEEAAQSKESPASEPPSRLLPTMRQEPASLSPDSLGAEL